MTTYKKTSPTTGKVSWFCTFYYKDYDGTRKQKKKEGFRTQREAKEYEKEFLTKYNLTSSMTFGSFAELYMKDIEGQSKQTYIHSKRSIIDNSLLPFFKDIPLNAITPALVKQWQLTALKGLKHDTVSVYHRTLSIMLNYAMKIYGIKENAAKIVGCPRGIEDSGTVKYHLWTSAQFQCFMDTLKTNAPMYKKYGTLFMVLFCSGMRIGELLALTVKDVDFQADTISISKTLIRLKGQDIVTTPKTSKGNRIIAMPGSVMSMLREYVDAILPIRNEDRIFNIPRTSIRAILDRTTKLANLPIITIHDLRHSHASFLIEKGFSIIAIRDRLGHENVQITLQTYSHLYPNKQQEIAAALEGVITI